MTPPLSPQTKTKGLTNKIAVIIEIVQLLPTTTHLGVEVSLGVLQPTLPAQTIDVEDIVTVVL